MWQLKDKVWQDSEFPFYHILTSRECGNMRINEEREQACSLLQIDYKSLVTAEQVHGNKIAVVDITDKRKQIAGVDGLITGTIALPLAIFTADCLPIFLGSSKGRTAGIIHAGWRGLSKGIIEKAVETFKTKLNIEPHFLYASIGPHIQKCCYEIGENVAVALGLQKAENKISLSAIAFKKLKALGVQKIMLSSHCTCHEDENFYSYRRERTAKRMMSLVRL